MLIWDSLHTHTHTHARVICVPGTVHTQFGFVYIFNLVIGVGALSLPKAFSQAGLILGTLLLFMLAFMSYMTATFMIEAMAAANAIFRYEKKRGLADSSKLSSLRPKVPGIQRVDDVSVCCVCSWLLGCVQHKAVSVSANLLC